MVEIVCLLCGRIVDVGEDWDEDATCGKCGGSFCAKKDLPKHQVNVQEKNIEPVKINTPGKNEPSILDSTKFD